jgi:hypothetical protein
VIYTNVAVPNSSIRLERFSSFHALFFLPTVERLKPMKCYNLYNKWSFVPFSKKWYSTLYKIK